ncbi:RNA polymerase III subunit C [Brevipalpus obovatus]|uniref:RNA polymerase III subunit C n=1 Tax=Brevipalpus obovatus TaxID=246614 RepID=UPI003D9ED771
MSAYQVRLCTQLLSEYFGEIVSKVGESLMQLGQSPLAIIINHCGQSASNCKKSIATLIQHQMVTFGKHSRGYTEYTINPDRVLLLLRYPRYIHIAKVMFGVIGEQIIEKILKDGMLTVDEIVQRVIPHLDGKVSEPAHKFPQLVYDVFGRIVQEKFIAPCCRYSDEKKSADWYDKPIDEELQDELIKLSPLNQASQESSDTDEPATKRRKRDIASSDSRSTVNSNVIYWQVNVETFHIAIRDTMIMEGLKTYYNDDKAAQLVRAILGCGASKRNLWIKETLEVPKNEIESCCTREHLFRNSDELDTYLLFLTDDNNAFVIRSGELAGIPLYRVNTFNIIDRMVKSCLSSAVIDRFGTRPGRIFNLLLPRKPNEPNCKQYKQIEEMAMMEPKDVKECTISLLENRFIKMMQFPKQNEYACFLFTTDIEDMCRNMLERSYHAVSNCIVRRNHEIQSHKSLIDRKVLIEAVIVNLRQQSNEQPDVEQQIEELNQSFSTHDRELLAKLKLTTTNLEIGELKIDETLILMETWIKMNLTS